MSATITVPKNAISPSVSWKLRMTELSPYEREKLIEVLQDSKLPFDSFHASDEVVSFFCPLDAPLPNSREITNALVSSATIQWTTKGDIEMQGGVKSRFTSQKSFIYRYEPVLLRDLITYFDLARGQV